MRSFSLFFIVSLFLHQNISAQDGSDIRYVNIADVDTSYVGKTVHFDFYNNSFFSKKRDTVTFLAGGRPITFIEHREDNGFNNWFSRQYLEEISHAKNNYFRIINSVIKEVEQDSILVTSNFVFYGKDKHPVEGKSFKQDIWIKRNILSQVLVQSEQCCK